MFALVVSISGGTQPGSTCFVLSGPSTPRHPSGGACGGPAPRQADKVDLTGSGWLWPPGPGCPLEGALKDAPRDRSRGTQVMEDPDGIAGRRISLPRPAPPPADDLITEGPGLLMGGRMDLAEITGLTLEAVVPRFAGGAGVFVLEHVLKGSEPAGQTCSGEFVTRRLGTTSAGAGQRGSREAFAPGQVIAFASSSPYARCMNTGEPVVFREPDGLTMERLRPDGREVVSGCSSFLAVPLTARDTIVGMLAFARDPGAPAFGRRDTATAVRLGAQAGTAIVNAL